MKQNYSVSLTITLLTLSNTPLKMKISHVTLTKEPTHYVFCIASHSRKIQEPRKFLKNTTEKSKLKMVWT